MLRFTLTANSGILVEAEERRFFVDALHHEGDYPFSKVPTQLLQRMNKGDNHFRNVDYIVFSHDHPDHYSPDVVLDYLKFNSVRRLILPRETKDSREERLRQYLQEKQVPLWRLNLQRGEKRTYRLEKDIFLTAVGIRHMSDLFSHLDCCLLVLSIGKRHIVFLSDCDDGNELDYAFLRELPVTSAFVNPFFFNSTQGRRIITEFIQPKQLFLYHIPFAGEDRSAMRGLVKQAIRKYGSEFKKPIVFLEQEQMVIQDE